MVIGLECLPCILNQVIAASKISTDQISIQEKIAKDTLSLFSKYENFRYPPELSAEAQKIIEFYTGDADPYKKIKDLHIKTALESYPILKEFLNQKDEKLYWALKIASMGNSIDLAMYGEVDIESIIRKEMSIEFAVNDFKRLEEKIQCSKNMLIIADNAGETVFDRILIENLSHMNITYAVREKPILNDATIEDALASNMSPETKIISSGSTIAGTIINECSEEFLMAYNNADVVLSKGQGNYETLSHENREIFFLLKTKCPLVAQELGTNLGDYVLISNKKSNDFQNRADN